VRGPLEPQRAKNQRTEKRERWSSMSKTSRIVLLGFELFGIPFSFLPLPCLNSYLSRLTVAPDGNGAGILLDSALGDHDQLPSGFHTE
jgi:hypothetical protein